MLIIQDSINHFGWLQAIQVIGFVASFTLVVLSVIYYRLYRNKKENFVQKIAEKETTPIDPGDYKVDENEKNVFISKRYRGFVIRVSPVFSGKKRNPDQLMFYSSYRHNFDNEAKETMLAHSHQLADIDFSDGYGIAVSKSPAAKFSDLNDAILRFLFTRLHREYQAEFERQTVTIFRSPDPDYLFIMLRSEVRHHIFLGRRLTFLEGIVIPENNISDGVVSINGVPPEMNEKGAYTFSLQKAESYNWGELIPKIEKTISAYFPEGADIIYKEIDLEIR
ncbi:MAG: hypothetical protein WC719_01600 [Patescibacteria group bacterium]